MFPLHMLKAALLALQSWPAYKWTGTSSAHSPILRMLTRDLHQGRRGHAGVRCRTAPCTGHTACGKSSGSSSNASTAAECRIAAAFVSRHFRIHRRSKSVPVPGKLECAICRWARGGSP